MPVGRGWLILVGLVDLVFGALVLMMDPAQTLTFLGYFVGVSLIFRGSWSVIFADVHQPERAGQTA